MSATRASLRFQTMAVLLAVLALCPLAGCTGDDVRDNLRVLQEKEKLITSVRLHLLLAVDAQKYALLTPTEAQAKAFATKAREAMATARAELASLEKCIAQGKNQKESEALAAVSADFAELGAVDATLLGLAGRNTNLRAAALSRTEAALAMHRLQQALTPVIDAPFCPASSEALRVVTAGLSILSLHAQHIDESTDAGMDTLEAAMNRQNDRARAALENLSGLLPPDSAPLQTEARAAYDEFWQLTRQVLNLSRENTNIEAAALTIGRKRLLTAKALDDLAVLDAVVAEKKFTATR